MKLALISYSFMGSSTGYYHFSKDALIGGGEVYLHYLARFLKEEGCDVHIIQSADREEIVYSDGITVHKLKTAADLRKDFGMIDRYVFFNFLWKRAKVWKTADKIHFHDYLNAFPFGNRKMTGTCHGVNWDDPRYVESFKLEIYRGYVRSLAKYAIKNLKKMAANDTFFLRFVQSELPEYRDRVEVIPNFVDTKLFNPDNEGGDVRERYRDKFLILYPRNFGYGRGALTIIQAIRTLRERYDRLLLLMTGDGPEKPAAEELVKRFKLKENVRFVGHLDHFKQMPRLYATADVVVVPSVSVEGTSLSCLEAMASKRPVVVTNVGGLIDIVIDQFNGLVCRPNPKSLAQSLEKLIIDKKLRLTLADQGYEWVRKYHNYERWRKRYKEFLDI